jgi:Flp pilus assembly protein protease CpaA
MILDVAGLSVIIGWAAWVALYDLKNHLIRNRSLFVGLLVIYPLSYLTELEPMIDARIAALAGALILLALLDLIGAGDAKLLIMLLPWLDIRDWQATLVAFSLISLVHILLLWLAVRKIPTRIALAPAILLASAVNLAS